MATESLKTTWSSALSDELSFWEHWLTTDDSEVVLDRENRLKAFQRPLIACLASLKADLDGKPLRVLDVGAGPLTTLGALVDGHPAEVVAIDPLADPYSGLLERLGIEPPIPTIYGEGENLLRQFGENSFHGVYSANALDHCYAPMRVFQQMLAVVKPGGTIFTLCHNNVGEMEKYQGLHQWNITIREGRPLIWNKDDEIDIGHELEGLAIAKGEIDANDLVRIQIEKMPLPSSESAAPARGISDVLSWQKRSSRPLSRSSGSVPLVAQPSTLHPSKGRSGIASPAAEVSTIQRSGGVVSLSRSTESTVESNERPFDVGSSNDSRDALIQSLEIDRQRDYEQIIEFAKHGKNLETRILDLQRALENQEAHIKNLEAERQDSQAQLHDLNRHVTHVEAELSRRQQTLEGLESHIDNLETEHERDQRRMLELNELTDQLAAARTRDQEQIIELSERAVDLEIELSQRKRRIDELEAQNEALEADQERDQEQLSELNQHSENLAAEREKDQEQLLELARHIENLEAEQEGAEDRERELIQHAEDLKVEYEREESQVRELTHHAEDLEAELERDREQLREVSQHAANLEGELSKEQEQQSKLIDHASNLEANLAERQQFVEDLNVHIGNLEAERTGDHETIESLTQYVSKLESDVASVREQGAGLEDIRQRQGARLEEQAAQMEALEGQLQERSQQVRTLESLRAESDQRLLRSDAEIARLLELSSGRLRETERLTRQLQQLTSNFGVKVLRRVGLVKPPSD